MITVYEQETIILFNEADPMASIYTHNKTWQKHLEKKLGLKPVETNSQGGKIYEIDKKRIRPPRAPVSLSKEARAKMAERLVKLRSKV